MAGTIFPPFPPNRDEFSAGRQIGHSSATPHGGPGSPMRMPRPALAPGMSQGNEPAAPSGDMRGGAVPVEPFGADGQPAKAMTLPDSAVRRGK